MELLSLKCPLCGAGLSEACRHGNRFVCEYCGGTIYVDGAPAAQNDPGCESRSQTTGPEHRFCTPLLAADGRIPFNEALNMQLDDLVALQQRFLTSESIEPEIIKIFDGNEGATTETWQEKRHQSMAKKIGLEPEERLILFKSAAFVPLNRFRCGMFITNKRVGYFERGKAYAYGYGEVRTLLAEIGLMNVIWWYPNEDKKVFIADSCCSPRDLTMLLTFILLKVGESNPEGSPVELRVKL